MRQGLFGRSIVGRAMEILLIEDELDEARAAMQILNQGHVRCRVTLVRDGEEALRFLRRHAIFAKAPRPDLILMDLDLPKLSGCEILAEVHADDELKRIPVVVMQTPAACADALNGECYDIEYMPKPLDAERFVAMVKSLHFSLLSGLIADSMV
jgi:CheY-like chemotaxis protein